MNCCIICGNKTFKPILGNLRKCLICDLVDFPLKKNYHPEFLYEEKYFKGQEYLNYKKDKKIIQLNFNNRLKEITKYITKGKLLEIGCAYGYFLEKAKSVFKVSGIDIAPEATEFARKKLGLSVDTGSYLNKNIFHKLDVIALWDTIEHLEHPHKFVKKISSDLKLNGYVFLTTGDIESRIAKAQGPKWRMIHPPTHLYYFSKNTITRLLNKHGFEVISVTYPGIYRNIGQILYSLLILNRSIKFKIITNVLNKINFPVYLNTFDIMSVVAKKIK